MLRLKINEHLAVYRPRNPYTREALRGAVAAPQWHLDLAANPAQSCALLPGLSDLEEGAYREDRGVLSLKSSQAPYHRAASGTGAGMIRVTHILRGPGFTAHSMSI